MMLDAQLEREKMQIQAQTAERTATLNGQTTLQAKSMEASKAPKDDGKIEMVVKELARAHSTPRKAKRNPDGSWDVRPA
jgi:hypothetical protein